MLDRRRKLVAKVYADRRAKLKVHVEEIHAVAEPPQRFCASYAPLRFVDAASS
jgi:hypothetical protein